MSSRKFYARQLASSALAEHTIDANRQHYELPPEFFLTVLGDNRKYSCAWYDNESVSLTAAEEAALAITVARAELVDGMDILELGCGWGSLTLYMAQKFPHSRITAISNSRPQREFIEAKAASLGLTNVQIKTLDLSSPESSLERTSIST